MSNPIDSMDMVAIEFGFEVKEKKVVKIRWQTICLN